ncbi:hypothetical protein C8F01DRAFT_499940 [Mycena amicta]|nr:hypothetical protein C8F01DRAFT_499940 [Mycena amicta]
MSFETPTNHFAAGGNSDTFLYDFSIPDDPFITSGDTWGLFAPMEVDAAAPVPAPPKFAFAFQGSDATGEMADIFEQLRLASGVRDMDIYDDGSAPAPVEEDLAVSVSTYAPVAEEYNWNDYNWDSDSDSEAEDSDIEVQRNSPLTPVNGTFDVSATPPRRIFSSSSSSFDATPVRSTRRTPVGKVGNENVSPDKKKALAKPKKSTGNRKKANTRRKGNLAKAKAAAVAPTTKRAAAAAKKTKAARAASPIPLPLDVGKPKKQSTGIAKGSFNCAKVPVKAVEAAKQAGKTVDPAQADGVPECYHYLFLLGCQRHGPGGMICLIDGCTHPTNNFADMTRHIYPHFREELESSCPGCPQTFSRDDALKRHVENPRSKKNKSHCKPTDPARKDLVEAFKELPHIVALRKKMLNTPPPATQLKADFLAEWENYLDAV